MWVNGVEIGDHRAGGYVAFSLDVPTSAANTKSAVGHTTSNTTNELFVLVDNRFNSTTAPMHTGGDFWHFGGIMRSVELHIRAGAELPAVCANADERLVSV